MSDSMADLLFVAHRARNRHRGCGAAGALVAGSTNIAFDNANDLLMIDINGDATSVPPTSRSIRWGCVGDLPGPEGLSQFTFALD